MTGIDEITKRKIISTVRAIIPEAKVILYGSRARGTHHQGSDIDIALDSGKKLSRLDVSEVRDMLEASHIINKIDVVDLYAISADMRSIILQEGMLWND